MNSVFFFFIFFFILKNKLLSLLLSRCLCLSVVKRTLNLNSLFSRFLLFHSLALKILFPKKLFHLLKNIKVVAIWIIIFFLKFVASTRFISFIFLTPWLRRSSFCQRSLMMKVFWLRDDNQMLMRIIEWIFLFSSLEYCSSHCQPREKVTFTPQNFFLCLIRDEKGFFSNENENKLKNLKKRRIKIDDGSAYGDESWWMRKCLSLSYSNNRA